MLFILFTGCSTQRANRLRNKSMKEWASYQWEENEKLANLDRGWHVYSRKVKDSKFKEFKIEGLINVSPSKAITTLREKTENSKLYLDEKEGFVDVLNSAPKELLVYSVYHMPFPFKDRSMCERFTVSIDSISGVHKISWMEDWTAYTGSTTGTIKMPIARGFWLFEPTGEGTSKASYCVHAEPGGHIPAWMVNATVGKGLSKEFESLEDIAANFSQK